MKTVALSAHYDGTKIELDEPYPLSENAQLVVIVLPHRTTIATIGCGCPPNNWHGPTAITSLNTPRPTSANERRRHRPRSTSSS